MSATWTSPGSFSTAGPVADHGVDPRNTTARPLEPSIMAATRWPFGKLLGRLFDSGLRGTVDQRTLCIADQLTDQLDE
jgi:hypothetical protein